MYFAVETLLSLGADVNARVHQDDRSSPTTALHYAVQAGLEDTCRLLLEYGADPWAPLNTFDVSTPLTWAYAHRKAEVLRVFESRLAIFSGWFRFKILQKPSSGRSQVRWLIIMPTRHSQGLLESYNLLAYNDIPASTSFEKLELTDIYVSYDTKGTFNSTRVLSLRKLGNLAVWKIQSLKGNTDVQLEQLRALCIFNRVPVAVQQGEQRPTTPFVHPPIVSSQSPFIGEGIQNSFTVNSEESLEGSLSGGFSFNGEEEIDDEEEATNQAIAESVAWARLNGVNVSNPESILELTPSTSPSSSSRNGPNVRTLEARNVTSSTGTGTETGSVGRGGGGGEEMGRNPMIGSRIEEMDEETQLALAMAESLEWARCAGIPTDTDNCQFTDLKKSQSISERSLSPSPNSSKSTEKPENGKWTHVVEPRKEVGEERESTSECTICCTNPVNAACVPCGHMMSCLSCLELVKKLGKPCPVCREPIIRALKCTDYNRT